MGNGNYRPKDNALLCVKVKGLTKRQICPDCLDCQVCSMGRCELCRKGGYNKYTPELGPFMTHGEFMEWKKKAYDPGN